MKTGFPAPVGVFFGLYVLKSLQKALFGGLLGLFSLVFYHVKCFFSVFSSFQKLLFFCVCLMLSLSGFVFLGLG